MVSVILLFESIRTTRGYGAIEVNQRPFIPSVGQAFPTVLIVCLFSITDITEFISGEMPHPRLFVVVETVQRASLINR